MDVYEQLSLFSNNNDQQRSKMDYQERPLQVMRLYYGGITNTCSDELLMVMIIFMQLLFPMD